MKADSLRRSARLVGVVVEGVVSGLLSVIFLLFCFDFAQVMNVR